LHLTASIEKLAEKGPKYEDLIKYFGTLYDFETDVPDGELKAFISGFNANSREVERLRSALETIEGGNFIEGECTETEFVGMSVQDIARIALAADEEST
jgi:hypothetical protein